MEKENIFRLRTWAGGTIVLYLHAVCVPDCCLPTFSLIDAAPYTLNPSLLLPLFCSLFYLGLLRSVVWNLSSKFGMIGMSSFLLYRLGEFHSSRNQHHTQPEWLQHSQQLNCSILTSKKRHGSWYSYNHVHTIICKKLLSDLFSIDCRRPYSNTLPQSNLLRQHP